MGGEVNYKIPDYKIYKVDGVKPLEWTRNELAKKGLKDPWLRNEVWRYQQWQGWMPTIFKVFKKGFMPGLALTLITIGIDKATGFTAGHHDEEHH
ncbi:hypothetical protein CAPTEDRAFT_205075 [Capitella teleta]|uniref:Uncharacterized protein n=1 Tax=Capitella teleta TaxID=283909 RepID=R7T9A3_CAPTE|nr:hypothetical protein CAPTEDRAFT_205075 [Capitella teleta]|eukprot:ELT90293.1 hypothetical protein CAPTEDRAFT_205075 [Capitella teleta]